MCLEYNDLKILPNKLAEQLNNVELTGWKKYDTFKKNGKLFVYSHDENLEVGVWLKANKRSLLKTEIDFGSTLSTKAGEASPRKEYRSGFHIFLSRDAARNYTSGGTLFKVKFRKLRTVGINATYNNNSIADCVIAEEMYIIPNSKRKSKKKGK